MSIRTIIVPPTLHKDSIPSMVLNLQDAIHDQSVSIIVLAGKDGVFCRGMDLDVWNRKQKDELEPSVKGFTGLLKTLLTLPKPIIAKVDGCALAGGLGIAAASDVLVATKDSRFGLPEGNMGLVPSIILPALMLRLSMQKIRRLAFSCSSIGAEEASRIGLVDFLVAQEELDTTVNRHARRMGRAKAESVKALRSITGKIWTGDFDGMLSSCELVTLEMIGRMTAPHDR